MLCVMPTTKKEPVNPLADWPTTISLDNGAPVTVGDEISVHGEGRYRVNAIRPNGELNCWGKIDSNGLAKQGSMRTFTTEQIKTVHVKKRMQDTLRAEDTL